jgi:hypothetical protein
MGFDLAGGVSGGLTGAGTGSVFGTPGSVVGGLAGFGLGLFRKKKKKKRESTLDPERKKLYDEYMEGLRGQGPMAGLYNWDAEGANENFDKNVSRPAYRNFQENIVPGITGQYRQNNLMNSSYSGEALSRSGRDVQEALDARRSDMHFQGQDRANKARRSGINSSFNIQTERDRPNNPSSIDNILNGLTPSAAKWLDNKINPTTSPTA